jgi:S1-C subfamily serine protease
MIVSVQPNSPAAKAGLKGLRGNNTNYTSITIATNNNGTMHLGDIITAINGHSVRQMEDIINYIDSIFPGNNVNLTVNRSGKIIHLTADLQPRPAGEVAESSLPPSLLSPP